MIFTVRKDKEPSQSKKFNHKVFEFYILVFSLQHAYFEIKSISYTLEQLVDHESALMFLGLGL
jgi:hypothetical protein